MNSNAYGKLTNNLIEISAYISKLMKKLEETETGDKSQTTAEVVAISQAVLNLSQATDE